jgi:hypothetical protein
VRKKNDRRFAEKMIEAFHSDRKMTYARLAELLRAKGYDLTPSQVFSIACNGRKADKELQQAIADILGCLRKDIF